MSQLVRLLVPAGKASPSPPVGPALGQRGVKSIDFCKQFNDRTKQITPNLPMRVQIVVRFEQRLLSLPPERRQAAGVEKGTARPSHTVVGEINMKQIYEIGKIKLTDPGHEETSLEAMCSRITHQAKAIGLKVVA